MPGRERVPSFQLPIGTTDERDGSYNLTTVGNVFYNTDTSNVEIRHVDPSNSLAWRDLVVNNKEIVDISGNLKYNNIRFFAYNDESSQVTFQNGQVITLDHTTINTNSCFNTASYYFGVPITGVYRFSYNFFFNTTNTSQNYNNIIPQKSIDNGATWFDINTGDTINSTSAASGGQIILGQKASGWAASTTFILELNGGDYIRLANRNFTGWPGQGNNNDLALWMSFSFFCGEIITAL